MEGAAILFPRDKYAPDEYEFQGPVKAIQRFQVLDTYVSQITLTIARRIDEENTDIDVELYVSERAWQTAERPVPGADVRGLMWLQGFLVP